MQSATFNQKENNYFLFKFKKLNWFFWMQLNKKTEPRNILMKTHDSLNVKFKYETINKTIKQNMKHSKIQVL